MADRFRFETRSGVVEGRIEDGLRVLRGVPFAAAPSGVRRWTAPAREAPWSGIRDASQCGPTAPQRASLVMRMVGLEGAAQDEDCLTLQVWTPASDSGRRPVLVWLHGGGFTSGAGSLPLFDAAVLARRGDAVVVTINYRLGALGFLALAEPDAVANAGLLDQIAALEWVRDHAAALGGDPANVTVFGESAGAMSIGALLGAPRARGLFAKAILQSGAAHNVSSRVAGARVAALFREALGEGAGSLDALRALPVDAVIGAQGQVIEGSWRQVEGLAFQPCVDAAALPAPPLDAVARGKAAGVPLLVGTNLDEWRLFAVPDAKLRTMDLDGLRRRLVRVPPGPGEDPEALADRAIAVYRDARAGVGCDPPSLWLAMQTDRVFRVPAIRLAERQGRHAPVFMYRFDWASPALGGLLGACHGIELPFVFGTLEDPRAAQLVGTDDDARRLAREMQDAWLAFARRGDPGWHAYTDSDRVTRRFARESGLESDPMREERLFWEPFL